MAERHSHSHAENTMYSPRFSPTISRPEVLTLGMLPRHITPPEQFPAGRVCTICNTRLNRYNPDTICCCCARRALLS